MTMFLFVHLPEKKRRVYDQYGKEGLDVPSSKGPYKDAFETYSTGTFVFRDPEEVFREFFGGSNFGDLHSKYSKQ